jgi:hypothetical protein
MCAVMLLTEHILNGLQKAIYSLPEKDTKKLQQDTVRFFKQSMVSMVPRANLSQKTGSPHATSTTDHTDLPAHKTRNTHNCTQIIAFLEHPAYRKVAKSATLAVEWKVTHLVNK